MMRRVMRRMGMGSTRDELDCDGEDGDGEYKGRGWL